MLAREVPRKSKHSSFKRLVGYLVNPMDTQERVGHTEMTNCETDTPAAAVLGVLATQAQNTRTTEKTCHLLVSFQQGDEPSPELRLMIEARLCQVLGFGEHQRISVVHHDTDNLHVHIALNRIHPTSLNGHWPRWSRYVLAYASETLERELGMLQETQWHLEKKELGPARSALRVYLENAFVSDALACNTWTELHALAATHGLALQPRGQGLEIRHRNGARVPASKVARPLSLGQLQARLGPFVGSDTSWREHHAQAQVSVESTASQYPSRTPITLVASRQPGELQDRNRSVGVEKGPPHPDRHAHRAAPVPPPPRMESLADVESFCGWVQRNHAAALREADSWRAVHAIATESGFAIRLRNNGLVFESAGGVVVRGSAVARELSKGRLEKRLGPYEPPSSRRTTATGYRPRVQSGSSTLYERYREDQNQRREDKKALLDGLRAEQDAAFATWKERSQNRRGAIYGVTRSRTVRALWHGYATRIADRERELLKTRFKTERVDIQGRFRQEGWLEWLRRQAAEGKQEALDALRSRSRREQRAQSARRRARDDAQAQQATGQDQASGHTAFGSGVQTGSHRTGGAVGGAVAAARSAGSRQRDPAHTTALRDLGSRRLREQFFAAQAEQRRLTFIAEADLNREELAAQAVLQARSARRREALRPVLQLPTGRRIFEPHLRRADERELRAHLLRFVPRRRQLLATPKLEWKAWLQHQIAAGNSEALAASPTPFAEVDHVTSEGTIVYSVPGAQVRDDGQRLSLSSDENPVALEAFLHLAHARIGPKLDVDGSATFRERIAQVAAAGRISISFADPELERVRKAHLKSLSKEQNRDHRPHRIAAANSGSADLRDHERKARPTADRHPRYAAPTGIAPAQPYPGVSRKRRTTSTLDSLSSLPQRDVVRDGNAPGVLLPDHPRPDLQRSQPEHSRDDHSLRRGAVEHRTIAKPPPLPTTRLARNAPSKTATTATPPPLPRAKRRHPAPPTPAVRPKWDQRTTLPEMPLLGIRPPQPRTERPKPAQPAPEPQSPNRKQKRGRRR